MRSKSKVNKSSKMIVEKTKRLKIGEIFEKLDGDKDGLVSKEKIDLNVLSDELLEIFKPLLLELD